MTDFTLTIPQNVVQHARNIANETSQPVENILLEQLQLWAEAVPFLSSEEEAELQALQYLSDDALWTIAREQMPESTQARMQILMDKNNSGDIADKAYQELSKLVERGQRLMLCKSEASALLTKRGYSVDKRNLSTGE